MENLVEANWFDTDENVDPNATEVARPNGRFDRSRINSLNKSTSWQGNKMMKKEVISQRFPTQPACSESITKNDRTGSNRENIPTVTHE